MQLSKRLQAVADLITPGSRVADVGCDHAYIPIYLAESKLSPQIIAMDINQGPIDRAKENIIKYGFTEKIITRKSDGLAKLEPDEADSIVIAGMGGALTIQILENRPEVLKTIGELVLQPQSEIYKVRRFLNDQDFLITKEEMVLDDGKYYFMMKAVPGSLVKAAKDYRLTQKEHFYYGRLLLDNRHPVLKEYLLWDLSLCENIQKSLENERTDNSLMRLEEIRDRIELIQCGLGYY